jgi:hypothetical protein
MTTSTSTVSHDKPKKVATAPKKAVTVKQKPKKEHWTVEFFKRVDAWGDALREGEKVKPL